MPRDGRATAKAKLPKLQPNVNRLRADKGYWKGGVKGLHKCLLQGLLCGFMLGLKQSRLKDSPGLRAFTAKERLRL